MQRAYLTCKSCKICEFTVCGGSNIRRHLRGVHGISIKEYRKQFGENRIVHNKKYFDPRIEVSCCICSKKFFVDTRWHAHRIRKGKTRFACPSTNPRIASECKRKLQALTIREVRSTGKSRALTSQRTVAQWKDLDKKSKMISAMKVGMASSSAYQTRGLRISETRSKDPEKYAAAMRRAWDTRGRPEKKRVSFECGACRKQIFRDLPPKGESLLIPILKSRGFKYCGDNTFHIGMLNPDFVNESEKTVFEHYGCWWHGCTECFPGREQLIQNTARFGFRHALFLGAGYKHAWIWGCEMKRKDWESLVLTRVSSPAAQQIPHSNLAVL